MTGHCAMIGWGQVRHTRHRPAHHAFVYPSAFLMLPMRSLAASSAVSLGLARNRWAPLAFHDADHGDGRSAQQGGALAWLDEVLAQQGVTDAAAEVWLQTFPRMWGHAFKPVSFWYAHRADGTLAAIVAEVNNTFGERHCYVLPGPRYGQTLQTQKVFHVSPFCSVQGSYQFRFMRVGLGERERIVARVAHADADGPLIDTSWSGQLEPATAAALRRVLWRFPWLSVGVLARIHWQAVQLWLKKVPFWRKPPQTYPRVTQ